MDPGKARVLEELVGYCQVKKYRRTAYVNILLRDTRAGELLFPILQQALGREGTRDYSGGIQANCHKELKQGLEEARKKRGGGAK